MKSNKTETLLTFDIGNSNPHVGLFSNSKLNEVVPLKELIIPTAKFKSVFSKVGGASTKSIESQIDKTIIELPILDNNKFIDMNVSYENSLGLDRLYQAYYQYKASPEKDILLIDAGTFITIDLITKNGFMGGYILPGIQSYLSCYSSDGANLPSINKNDVLSSSKSFGKTTNSAILNSWNIQITTLLSQLIKNHSSLKIIVTGGDMELLRQLLPKEISSHSDAHLIHKALYFLYNLQKKNINQ